jgi:large subunit ribosomal protein LP1
VFQEDKINALIKAAGVSVEPFWPGLFAKVSFGVTLGNVRFPPPALIFVS